MCKKPKNENEDLKFVNLRNFISKIFHKKEKKYIEEENSFLSSEAAKKDIKKMNNVFHQKVNFSYFYVMKAYSQYVEEKTRRISCYRTIFFVIILLVFIAVVAISLTFLGIGVFENSTTTIVSSIVAFVTNILVFPLIIAKYLFNHDEDKDFIDLYKAYFTDFSKNETEQLKIQDNSNIDDSIESSTSKQDESFLSNLVNNFKQKDDK